MEAEPLVVPPFVLSGQADATGAGLRHGQGEGLQGTEHHWALACSALGLSGETRLEKKTELDVKYMNVRTRFCCTCPGWRAPGEGNRVFREAALA